MGVADLPGPNGTRSILLSGLPGPSVLSLQAPAVQCSLSGQWSPSSFCSKDPGLSQTRELFQTDSGSQGMRTGGGGTSAAVIFHLTQSLLFCKHKSCDFVYPGFVAGLSHSLRVPPLGVWGTGHSPPAVQLMAWGAVGALPRREIEQGYPLGRLEGPPIINSTALIHRGSCGSVAY